MAAKRSSGDADRRLESGTAAAPSKSDGRLHPAFFIALWIFLSSSVILFNKWVLATAKFDFPLFLTTWHMVFATITTQIMARFTKTLDSRHKVPMTPTIYGQSIVPIGILFSFSLICGNMAYLYLSVSFIQMLKATNAVATLLATWAFRIVPPNFRVLGNVSVIVVGIVIASFGEIKFDLTGFIYQVSGIIFEALRLVMVQRLLSSAEFKMDPLVSLYYYAPACAVTNGIFTLFIEIPRITMGDIYGLGISTLVANAIVAFLLNVSVVLLIGQTSAVVLTMSGVLKDILLVVASMVIFRDPVTGQQFFGYSIALAGLVYYRLGAEKMQSLAKDVRLQLGNFRHQNPARTKILANVAILAMVVFGLWMWGPYFLGQGEASQKL
ncbi:triose-phosphate transporter family-domain-containing protein [Ilyonectria robusta]|uniref:triose-phosphate transporter family-domain-containing protein n=1 Tax=Ilyonectria robusta TaxID=1079257 RepID=UPI001E8DF016|nr:triose-phosphate transporter family-domain-containing protein [Ilyonectria robusta]KAH8665416.1 triose-phosphate transporter family-domain-containing protein [Ilyonectria robusta]